MSKKCVHKGCGKTYENDDEECVYHPGPPVFHEGQKGGCASFNNATHLDWMLMCTYRLEMLQTSGAYL
jgi:hypothetical protein